MIILITSEMNIIDYQVNLTMVAFLIEKDKRNEINSIKRIFANSFYGAQWDKQDWVVSIIYIERSYVNRIIQVSMDRIIDNFKKKEP